MGVFPIPEGMGVRNSRGEEEGEARGRPQRGVVEDFAIAGEGVRKILHLTEDMRDVGVTPGGGCIRSFVFAHPDHIPFMTNPATSAASDRRRP